MAILKTLLDEEVLTKQERSLLRHLYRLNQLGEALKVVDSILQPIVDTQLVGPSTVQKLKDYRQRLIQLMEEACTSYSVPKTGPKVVEPQTPALQK